MEGVGDAASNEDIVEGAEHVGGGRLVGVVVPDAVDDVLVLVDAGGQGEGDSVAAVRCPLARSGGPGGGPAPGDLNMDLVNGEEVGPER